MIRTNMTDTERKAQFDQLLALALIGEAPPSENGFTDEVIDALITVVWKQTTTAAQQARDLFDATYNANT